MRRLILSCIFLSALFSLTAFSSTIPGEWLVRTTLENPTIEDFSQILGVEVNQVTPVVDGLYKVVIENTITRQTLQRNLVLNQDRAIIGLQPNFVYRILLHQGNFDTSNREKADNPAILPPAEQISGIDSLLSSQWGLQKIKAKEAWQIEQGDSNVIVAVVDTGIDYNHEDLRNALWRNPHEIPGNGIDDDGNGFVDDVVGWDFIDNDAFPYDKMSNPRLTNPGHGTHCSGVIGARKDNGKGISGVAPGVSIMALRFINDKGEGTSEGAIKAIDYAIKMGVKVISNSWGGEKGDEDDAELLKIINKAEANGVLLIFAAGNGRKGIGFDNDTDAHPVIPASYQNPNIIAVAAIDSSNNLGAFSNYGKTTVDLAAPGVKILSTVPENNYEDTIKIFGVPIGSWDGTSMAAPHVAGVAALVWSKYPKENFTQIKNRILRSVTKVSTLEGKVLTGGILNAAAAVE